MMQFCVAWAITRESSQIPGTLPPGPGCPEHCGDGQEHEANDMMRPYVIL